MPRAKGAKRQISEEKFRKIWESASGKKITPKERQRCLLERELGMLRERLNTDMLFIKFPKKAGLTAEQLDAYKRDIGPTRKRMAQLEEMLRGN